jgi:hypothetical protein
MQKARFGAEMLMGFVKGQTGLVAHEAGEVAGAGDAGTAESPSAQDNAPAGDANGKRSSLDRAGAAEASMGSWTPAVTVEPTSVEATNSQNTLSPDDLLPAWSVRQSAGT